MMRINRRKMIGGVSAFAASAVSSSALGSGTGQTRGVWTAMTDMPFPVQEIYPTVFSGSAENTDKIRPSYKKFIVNGGGLTPAGHHNVTNAVTYYDVSLNIWARGTDLPEARHHISMVNHNGYLYGVTGFARNSAGGWQIRRNCWRNDSLNGKWRSMSPLPQHQAETVCVSLSRSIHVVGGRSPLGSSNREWRDHIDTDAHWAFDPADDRWTRRAPMPTARNSATGAVLGTVLYVIGGRTVNDGNTNTVEVYDPLSDRWEKARPMPKAQAGLASAVLNGKIYVFGGEYFSPGGGGVFEEAWEYDPRKDKWEAVAPMPRPRHGLGAVSADGQIYTIGGALRVGGDGTTGAVDRFTI